MHIVDIIAKKRDHHELSKPEIQFFIDGLTSGQIANYQASALLMAIYLNGMNAQETAYLTDAMLHSGKRFDLSSIGKICVDKHSTGGVGDKTSLVLAPLVAACGAIIAKMSGRGLGHTGGTLDKLEAIEGFQIELSQEQFLKQVSDIGCAIIGQTDDLVKADKILYGLRDVTATVDSIPLIASSIMSKKLAAGTDGILLDVKCGDGAFMKNVEQATNLAQTMIDIGRHLNKDVRALISDMNQPLGKTIGNALEVKEAILTLRNQGDADFTELCLVAASILLVQAEIAATYEEGYNLAQQALVSGKAYEKALQWIEYQQGNIDVIKDLDQLPTAAHTWTLRASSTGYLKDIHTQNLGLLSMYLGGGREKVDDIIDYAVGLEIEAKVGDLVNLGDPLCVVHYNGELSVEHQTFAQSCFEFSETKVEKPPLILKVIDS